MENYCAVSIFIRSETIGIIIAVSCVILAFILFCLIYECEKEFEKQREERRKFVCENSELLKKSAELNEKYKSLFYRDIQEEYTCTVRRKSLHSYDKVNYRLEASIYLDHNASEINDAIKKAEINKRRYDTYIAHRREIYSNRTITSDEKWFKEIEDTKFRLDAIVAPVTSVRLRVVKLYSSAKGYSQYREYHDFLKDDIYAIEKENEVYELYKQTKQYQRNRMNDSIRYDVMKRDGFRCVLCGSTQNDGVKLHVDHIIPIAKGGKTEMDNLRTLCERCNMGKRDKYDPNGIN